MTLRDDVRDLLEGLRSDIQMGVQEAMNEFWDDYEDVLDEHRDSGQNHVPVEECAPCTLCPTCPPADRPVTSAAHIFPTCRICGKVLDSCSKPPNASLCGKCYDDAMEGVND